MCNTQFLASAKQLHISCAYQTAILVTGATSTVGRWPQQGSWPQPPPTWSVLAESAKSVLGLSEATAARHEWWKRWPEPVATVGRWPQQGSWPQPPPTWSVLAESAKSVGQPEPFATLVTILGLSQATAARHEWWKHQLATVVVLTKLQCWWPEPVATVGCWPQPSPSLARYWPNQPVPAVWLPSHLQQQTLGLSHFQLVQMS